MSVRRPISKRARFEVFKRDGFSCSYCGRHPPDVFLEVDHIIPVCEGGEDIEENLTTACFDCNRGKAGVPLTAVPRSLSAKAAEVVEREEQLAAYRAIMEARAERIEDDAWEIAEILFPVPAGEEMSVRRDWFRSIKIFNEKLPFHVVKEIADLARDRGPYREKGRFLYFCKVCWNKIREQSE
ncbi:MAG: HNH endonuclease [Proteobacteria bacterium]|nr:HNH endonuclease [Pseudomonadota bacterium]